MHKIPVSFQTFSLFSRSGKLSFLETMFVNKIPHTVILFEGGYHATLRQMWCKTNIVPLPLLPQLIHSSQFQKTFNLCALTDSFIIYVNSCIGSQTYNIDRYLLKRREGKFTPIKYTHLQTSFCLRIREVGMCQILLKAIIKKRIMDG